MTRNEVIENAARVAQLAENEVCSINPDVSLVHARVQVASIWLAVADHWNEQALID